MKYRILAIFVIAFLIRLIALNQSLWLDEAVTANVVKHFGFTQIVSGFSPGDFHPPLYYLFLKLWTNVFGYSEVALRFPSIIFSLLTGHFVYKIAKLLYGYMVGVWSATFFLFNPLIVYYSQEARMYMMVTFLLTAGLYYFFKNSSFAKALEDKQKLNSKVKSLILMNVFLTLAFLTFYGSAFLIATIILYFLIKRDYKIFILNTLYFILVILFISPLLYGQFVNSRIAVSQVANWASVLGKANLKDLLLIPLKFSIGRISFLPKWLYWGIAGVWTGFIIYQFSIFNLQMKKNIKFIYLFYYLLIFPLLIGFLVSFYAPMLQYFRFIYLIPIFAILLALGTKTSMYRYITVIGFVTFSLIYLLFPQFHREDWKSLVKNIPKDIPVYMIKASGDPILYYANSLSVNELTSLRVKNKYKEIIVIPYTAWIYGLDYKSLLSKNGYSLKKEVSFREVTYERWIK